MLSDRTHSIEFQFTLRCRRPSASQWLVEFKREHVEGVATARQAFQDGRLTEGELVAIEEAAGT